SYSSVKALLTQLLTQSVKNPENLRQPSTLSKWPNKLLEWHADVLQSVPMTILRVAVDVPLPKLFDYRSEDATRADIGYRVLVPFGKKRRVGLIWDAATKSKVTESRLRSVERVLRDVSPLLHDWLALADVCSNYYHA